MELVFRYYLHFVIFSILTYCIGKGIRKWLKLETYFFTDTFYSLLLGSIVCSTAQAIWATKGQTVHSAFILLGVAFLHFRNQQPTVAIHHEYKLKKHLVLFLASLFFVSLGLYAWESWWLFKSGKFPYIVPFKDIALYSLISDYIGLTGIENRLKYYNFIDENYQHLQLYHYFTLWSNNFVTKFLGGMSMNNYSLVVVNQLVLASFAGIIGFWEHLKQGQIKWWQLLMGVLFLFINTFYFEFYQSIHFLRNVHEFDFPLFDFMGKKVSYYYPFYIGFFILAANKRYIDAILIGLCLPISTVAILPSIAGGFVAAIFIWGVWQKYDWKKIAMLLSLVLLSTFSIFLINKIFGSPEVSTSKLPLQNLLNGIFSFQQYRTYFNIIIGTNIHFVVVYFPYIFLLCLWVWQYKATLAKQETYKFMLLFLFCLVEVTLIIWALLMKEQNAFQLVMFNILPLLSCTITFFLIQGLAQFNIPKWTYALVTLLLMANFYHIYTIQRNNKGNESNEFSDDYLLAIQELVNTKQITATGGFLLHVSDYNTDYIKIPAYEQAGFYLGLMMTTQATYSLSDMEIPEAMPLLKKDSYETTEEINIGLGAFFRFVKQQHKQKTFVSIDKSKREFMKKHDFSYLIVKKGVETNAFNDLISKEIVDSKSGEKFIVLKKWQ
jgi:hypothetical protein